MSAAEMEIMRTENERLKNALEIAEEKIALLKRELKIEPVIPFRLKFSPIESAIMKVLLSRHIVTRDYITLIVYDMRSSGEMPDSNVINVHVCHMRTKLKKFGLKIDNVRGQGFSIPPESKKRLQEMLAAEMAGKAVA